MGNSGDSFNINKLDEGVSRSFNPDQRGVGLESLLDSFEISKINEFNIEIKLFNGESSHVSVGTTINIIRNNNVRVLGETVDDTGHSSATRRESNSKITIFASSNTFFESISSGGTTSSIFVLGIEISRSLLSKSSAQMDGNIDGTMNLVRVLTSMNGFSGETSVLSI